MKKKKERTEQKKSWFGAKCVFVYPCGSVAEEQLFEERIVLLKAVDFDQAISRAEKEAHEYADADCIYTGFVSIFQIFSDEIEDGTEVYSLMRSSELDPSKYLDCFHDTGTERTQT